jgi:cell wall-associated NlpC family hydrolase
MKSNFLLFLVLLVACNQPESGRVIYEPAEDTVSTEQEATTRLTDTIKAAPVPLEYANNGEKINTGNTTPQQLLAFATSLIGTPYKYGSIDPAAGFDCSGFITYVFNHFNISVPRSSVNFTGVEKEISIAEAKPGDIILFTGTDSAIRIVGHMGIISSVSNNEVQFIHSTSGKANGVTITPLNQYYQGRYVKTLRIFSQNDATEVF